MRASTAGDHVKRGVVGVVGTFLVVTGFAAAPALAAGDTTPPARVTAATGSNVTKTSATLTWTNPSDADLAAVVIRRSVGAVPPASATSGTAVATVAAPATTTYTDTRLAPGIQYSYALFAADAVPNYATAANVTVTTTALSWTTSTPAPSKGEPMAVSCHLSTFCMLLDRTGHFMRYNGTSWTAPARVGTATGFGAVSCPALAFCLAVTTSGDAYRWNGTYWAPAAHVPAALVALSCPTAGQCWGVAGHYAYKYANGAWVKQLVAGLAGASLRDISCPTTTMCVAVGNANSAYGWQWKAGGPWSGPTLLYAYGGDMVWSVSCSSASNCVATGDQTLSIRFDGTRWGPRPAFTGSGFDLHSLSCRSSTFCMGLGYITGGGLGVSSFDGRNWSTPHQLTDGSYGYTVSCASTSMCVAVAASGHVFRWSGGRWGSATMVDHTSGNLQTVACPSTTSCVALDGWGNVQGFDGSRWGPPRLVGGNLLACPSASLCLTLDVHGRVRQHIGTSWLVVVTLPHVPTHLSCGSSTFCLGIEEGAQPVTVKLDGSRWVYEPNAPLSDGVTVSCAGSFWCMATDLTGHTATYNRAHSTWTRGVTIPTSATTPDAERLACTSPTFCLVSMSDGIHRFNGHNWALVGNTDLNTVAGCVTPSFCAMGGPSGSVSIFSGTAVSAWLPLDQAPEVIGMSCVDTDHPLCVGVAFEQAVVGR
jgi:hypothetical protein